MLTLDNAIQLTERDEFAYHEMLAHATMLSHPNPKQVRYSDPSRIADAIEII